MFYNNLIKLCEEKGVKITPLIKELGMSSGNMSRWQNGILPTAETLLKFSDYFGVTTDYLLGRSEKEKKMKKEPNSEIVKVGLDEWSNKIIEFETYDEEYENDEEHREISHDALKRLEEVNISIHRIYEILDSKNDNGIYSIYPTYYEFRSMCTPYALLNERKKDLDIEKLESLEMQNCIKLLNELQRCRIFNVEAAQENFFIEELGEGDESNA